MDYERERECDDIFRSPSGLDLISSSVRQIKPYLFPKALAHPAIVRTYKPASFDVRNVNYNFESGTFPLPAFIVEL